MSFSVRPWKRKRTLLENLAGSRSAEPDANNIGVSTDMYDSAESRSFHTTMSLEDAQELVDDWAMVQPLEQRKQLAITSFVTYRRRQKMSILDAAQEAASVTGFGERTIRRYWNEKIAYLPCALLMNYGATQDQR